VLAWFTVWGKMQICISPNVTTIHYLSLAPVNPNWFTFLVLAHPGSHGQRAIKWLKAQTFRVFQAEAKAFSKPKLANTWYNTDSKDHFYNNNNRLMLVYICKQSFRLFNFKSQGMYYGILASLDGVFVILCIWCSHVPHLICCSCESLFQMESFSVQLFLQGTELWPTQTDHASVAKLAIADI